MNPRHLAQVGLTAALNTMLDDTIVELQDLRTQQIEERKEIKRLRAIINGQGPAEVEEDEENWAAHSPSPKRTRYGSPSSRTRVIWG